MVIKITPNNAFHTRSCTIKSFKSLGEVWAWNFWYCSVARELCSLNCSKQVPLKKIFFPLQSLLTALKKIHYNNPTFPSKILFFYQIMPIYASENCSSLLRQHTPRANQLLISSHADSKPCKVSLSLLPAQSYLQQLLKRLTLRRLRFFH